MDEVYRHTTGIWNLTCDNSKISIILHKGIDCICISKLLSRDLVAIQLTIKKEGRKFEIGGVVLREGCDASISDQRIIDFSLGPLFDMSKAIYTKVTIFVPAKSEIYYHITIH